MQAPRPANEEERLARLYEYDVLNADPEAAFHDLARLASQVCGTPAAAVTLMDRDLQWFIAQVGFDMAPMPRDLSFCAHAILSPELTHVTDLTLEPHFRDSPLVTGGPGVRFYAGAPLVTPDGFPLGTLCVFDRVPRSLSPVQREGLEGLARLAVSQLELRRHIAERSRLQAEQERDAQCLRENRRMLSDLMGNVPGMVYRCRNDRASTMEFVSPGCLELTGYSPEEMTTGETARFIALIDPDHRERQWDELQAALRGRRRFRLVYPLIARTGERKWVWEQGCGVFGPDGELLHLEGFITDITERRRAEETLREREQQLQTVTDNVPVLIARVGCDRRYLFANRTYEDLLQIPPDQVLGRTMVEVLGEDAYETVRPYVDRALAGETVVYERMLNYRTVGPRFVHCTYVPERRAGGIVTGFVLSAIDITERRQAEEAVREREELLGSVLATIPHHVFWKDRDCVYRGCNENLARAAGLTAPSEIVGMTDYEMPWAANDAEAYLALDRRVMETGETILNEEQSLHQSDGTVITGLTTKIPLRDGEGRIVGVLGTYHDISDRKALEAEREALLAETERLLADAVARADRDPLTGLLNHRAFHACLEQEADRAQREGGPLAVVMMDLNNFKFFNDAYGHLAGDEVLRQVAGALQNSCRSYDTLARFGGDEFALLMPGVSALDAERQARRIVDDLGGLGYCPPGHGTAIPLSLSAGVAVFPDEAPGRLEAVDLADARLRTAKSGGDAAVVAAEQVRREMAMRIGEFTMLDALVAAVDNKDRYTRRHSEDVLTYSALIAASLGLGEEMRHTVAVAALLHDVGKIGVPDAVLRKPGRLTPAEMDAMRQHPQMGAVIVGAVPGFEDTLDAVRHHHERWDGQGYPFGLQGEDIPLTARILAVADAFSAMTTDRPYRKGMTHAEALALLQAGAGTQWDPALVAVFLQARSSSSLRS